MRAGISGLVAPERDVRSLITALRYLLENPARWAEMGQEGRRFVSQHFDPERLGRRWPISPWPTVAARTPHRASSPCILSNNGQVLVRQVTGLDIAFPTDCETDRMRVAIAVSFVPATSGPLAVTVTGSPLASSPSVRDVPVTPTTWSKSGAALIQWAAKVSPAVPKRRYFGTCGTPRA